jgi:hypothetical protein
MDQVRQLLRYVLPGFVYVVLTGGGLLIVFPDWFSGQFERIAAKDGLGAALSSILAIGALGYVFATVHHELHWICPHYFGGVFDHSELVKRVIPSEPNVTRDEAAPISYALWYQHVVGVTVYGEGADKKVCSLGDQTHGFGAACVASAFAVFTTLAVCWTIGTFSCDWRSVLRFLIMLTIGGVAVFCFHRAYRRVGKTAQRTYERILEEALKKQNLANPKAQDGKN